MRLNSLQIPNDAIRYVIASSRICVYQDDLDTKFELELAPPEYIFFRICSTPSGFVVCYDIIKVCMTALDTSQHLNEGRSLKTRTGLSIICVPSDNFIAICSSKSLNFNFLLFNAFVLHVCRTADVSGGEFHNRHHFFSFDTTRSRTFVYKIARSRLGSRSLLAIRSLTLLGDVARDLISPMFFPISSS